MICCRNLILNGVGNSFVTEKNFLYENNFIIYFINLEFSKLDFEMIIYSCVWVNWLFFVPQDEII